MHKIRFKFHKRKGQEETLVLCQQPSEGSDKFVIDNMMTPLMESGAGTSRGHIRNFIRDGEVIMIKSFFVRRHDSAQYL